MTDVREFRIFVGKEEFSQQGCCIDARGLTERGGVVTVSEGAGFQGCNFPADLFIKAARAFVFALDGKKVNMDSPEEEDK